MKIGNNNKIINSTISESNCISKDNREHKKKNFFEKHPVVCSIVISFIVGFILLFNFWKNIATYIESSF